MIFIWRHRELLNEMVDGQAVMIEPLKDGFKRKFIIFPLSESFWSKGKHLFIA